MTFANLNVAMNSICDVRIDIMHSLTKDGFLRNHQYLSQWFLRKYPSCSSSNYLNIIGEIENAKENGRVMQNHLMKDGNFDRIEEIGVKTNDKVYHQHYDGDKVKKHLFKWSYKKENNVNGDSNKNAVILKKIVVFNNRMNKKEDGRYNIDKRRLNIGRSLIGEWDEQTSGTYQLSNDVTTTGTIIVNNGNALDITGNVDTRPAIDGGESHRVFLVQDSGTKLTLTGITIKNGVVCIYLFHFQILYNGMANCFVPFFYLCNMICL